MASLGSSVLSSMFELCKSLFTVRVLSHIESDRSPMNVQLCIGTGWEAGDSLRVHFEDRVGLGALKTSSGQIGRSLLVAGHVPGHV